MRSSLDIYIHGELREVGPGAYSKYSIAATYAEQKSWWRGTLQCSQTKSGPRDTAGEEQWSECSGDTIGTMETDIATLLLLNRGWTAPTDHAICTDAHDAR